MKVMEFDSKDDSKDKYAARPNKRCCVFFLFLSMHGPQQPHRRIFCVFGGPKRIHHSGLLLRLGGRFTDEPPFT